MVIWVPPPNGEVAEAIQAACPEVVLAPPTDLAQLVLSAARCQLLVSGDTGPLHLSMAVNTPAVGLFGPVPAERNGVRGCGYRNLQAPGAAWERRDASKGVAWTNSSPTWCGSKHNKPSPNVRQPATMTEPAYPLQPRLVRRAKWQGQVLVVLALTLGLALLTAFDQGRNARAKAASEWSTYRRRTAFRDPG